ncbi:MAG: adenylosuccinate synthase [Candidatus Thorarchaeota archaeon]|nr:adenylosuccinate synthase [Candidatus Thorarchaeota archaeon]
MQNLVVIGLQWGDEGKGKLVDVLSGSFDIVTRFQGGSNAGHTVKVGDDIYKFRIIPTGAVRGKKAVIGNGVVLDPNVLLEEIKKLESAGVNVDLLISDRAHIITLYHIEIDGLQELSKGERKVGTTKRGIGPTYSDKISRSGVRICDLLETSDANQWSLAKESLIKRIESLHDSTPQSDPEETVSAIRKLIASPNCRIGDSGEFLDAEIEKGKRVIFEGAQGALLDIDHGTYPFVTSSNCVSAAAATGTGVSPFKIGNALGICKAYMTRVGAGPFPTELDDIIGERIRELGKEFGTVTGRPRRCGWLDLVALRYAVRINGVQHLAITKLDVLNGINPLKFCVAYIQDGVETTSLPANAETYSRVEPVYREVSGWDEIPTGQSIDYANLPQSLQEYLSIIEAFSKAKVAILSIGPDRVDTIMVPGTPFEEFKDA